MREPIFESKDYSVGTESLVIRIDASCSGYEGMGLIVVFLGAYLLFFRQQCRFPNALMLVPIGVALMWLANVARLTALIVIGTWGSHSLAIGGFHSQAGWILFNAVALGLMAVAQRVQFFTRQIPRPITDHQENPTAAYLLPFLTIIGIEMVTRSLSNVPEWWYPLRVLGAAGVSYWFRRSYRELRWSWSWQAVAIGALAFGIWIALAQINRDSTSRAVLAPDLGGASTIAAGLWLFFRVIGAVITVPLVEELAFRGYLTRRLITVDFSSLPLDRFNWVSYLLSSVLFGVLHGNIFAGTLLGMFYALALYRRGNLVDAVVAHAVTNALLMVYVLATGDWSLWF